MVPFSSVSRMPSAEFSHTEWNSISELRNAASASLRSVMSRTCKQHRRLAGVADPVGPHLDGNRAAVLRPARPLDLLEPAFHQRLEIARHVFAQFGRDQVADVLADQLFARQAVQLAARWIDVQHGPVEVLDEDRIRRAFEQFAEALLAFAQGLLRVNPFQRPAAMVRQRLQRIQMLPDRTP